MRINNTHKIDLTLGEQMKINDREIKMRMDLLEFSDYEAELLKSYASLIVEKVDTVVDSFYKSQVKVPAISLLIGDSETLRRLKGSMRQYVLELFEGHYDVEYANRRLRIGIVHKRIGVEPKLYISAIWLLQRILYETIDQSVPNDLDAAKAGKIKRAVNKLLTLDTQFVFDTYISSLVFEVESARLELEEYSVSLEETINERTRQLKEMSLRDSLTGLYNQRAFYEHLRREYGAAERYREPITIVYFDLDGFKSLNDSAGHHAGDKVLTQVGEAVSECVREMDIPCRIGGDEFCIILPRTEQKQSLDVVDRIIECFSADNATQVTFSIGVATTGPDVFLASDELVKTADKLMYRSKDKLKQAPGFHISLSENEQGPKPGSPNTALTSVAQ